MNKWWSPALQWVKNNLRVSVISLCIIAISGIIGNRSDAFFLQVLPLLKGVTHIQIWLLLIINVIVVSVILILIRQLRREYQRASKLEIAHQLSSQLNKLDESLILTLLNLDDTKDHEHNLALVIDQFLHSVVKLLNIEHDSHYRISVFRPEGINYLKMKYQIGFQRSSQEETQFYIGGDGCNESPGIVGKAFMEKRLIVASMFKHDNGAWLADTQDYRFLEDFENTEPPHLAVLATPINNGQRECLGVLCLDSKAKAAFSSPLIQGVLESIGNRLILPFLMSRMFGNTS